MGKILTARKAGGPDYILMVSPRLSTIRSDKDLHFTEELDKNESEQENLTGLISNKIRITEVTIVSDQDLHFQLQFFSRDTFVDSDLDEDTFVGMVNLDLSTYGEQPHLMAEDFNGYTKVDPNSKITKTSTRVTWVDLDRNETAYVYLDKGAAYFDGDFTQLLTVCMTTLINGSYVSAWALTNVLNSLRAIDSANGDFLALTLLGLTALVVPTIALVECNGGTAYSDSYDASLATPYYLKIVRDESVGDYGTLYCYIYSDSARTRLLDTLTLTLHSSKKDFRYIHAVNSDDASVTPYPGSGYSENLITPAILTYFMSIKNLNIPYEGLDKTKELHILLKNLSPTAKKARAAGEVVIEVKYEPAA